MIFNKESDFEEALIKILSEKGWEKEVLKNYSEQDLLRNWANILFENNRDIDRLNDYPLTDSEMQQILEQIEALRTPLKLNGFINGKSVSIVRDNPDDKLHLGKEVSLKIYDRREIAAGQSRYQIVQQPKFPTKSKLLNDRRGDLMLLITENDYGRSKTIFNMFSEMAQKIPERTVVVFKDKRYTYKELDEISDRLGKYIASLGIGREDVVSILIPRCEYMAIAPLGVIKAGAAYQPLDPTYPKDRLMYMLEDAQAKLLIVDRELLPLVDGYEGKVLYTIEQKEINNIISFNRH